MFHEDILVHICTVNISKMYFWLVICLAKNFIWTTLKAIVSIFRFFLHPQIPDFQIVVYLSQILPCTNHTSMESLFIQLSYLNFENMTLMTGFVVQGHICILCLCLTTTMFMPLAIPFAKNPNLILHQYCQMHLMLIWGKNILYICKKITSSQPNTIYFVPFSWFKHMKPWNIWGPNSPTLNSRHITAFKQP